MTSSKSVPKFLLTLNSNNVKTGPMPVSTSPMQTCPETCPFRERGCYAGYGPVRVWWMACTNAPGELSTEYQKFLIRVRDDIPTGQVWRHNQGGDLLPLTEEMIDETSARELTLANVGKKGFTYTHYGVIEQRGTSTESARHNRAIIERMNEMGFVVSVSCNSIDHADRVKNSGIKAPVVCVVPESYASKVKAFDSPGGNRVLVCPAITKHVTCTECGLCMRSNRKVIIAFAAHGSGKKRAEEVFTEWSTGDYVAPDVETQAKLDKEAAKRKVLCNRKRAKEKAEKAQKPIKVELKRAEAKMLSDSLEYFAMIERTKKRTAELEKISALFDLVAARIKKALA